MMDSAEKKMIENIEKKFGKSVDKWIELVKSKNLQKHTEIIKYLKDNHGFTHGYANYISMKARKADAGSSKSSDELIINQYKGKETLHPIYNKIIRTISKFGKDVQVVPKKSYVSIRSKTQFAIIQPSTKTRVDLGLKLKGVSAQGRLESSGPFGSMCTHRVKIFDAKEIDKELISWIKLAYEKAN